MSASKNTSANRFKSLTPDSLSKSEQSVVVKLALSVLSQRCRRGRVFKSSRDFEDFLRLFMN